MKDTLFTILTDATKRDTTMVELACTEQVNAGAPWYDKPTE